MLAILVLTLGLMVFRATTAQAEPMGSAFTYQGRLMDGNSPADGLYDLQFKLYDSPSDGNQLANTLDLNELDVIDGHFALELDFGIDVFAGNTCYLELGVRPGELSDPSAYTTLSPRQQITPAPYFLQKSTGREDTPMGKYAAATKITGYLNPLLGLEEAYSTPLVEDPNYTLVGYEAGGGTGGPNDTFVGAYAGYSHAGDWDNTFIGHYAGHNNTTGWQNTFLGVWSGWVNTTGIENTFLGSGAGESNIDGYDNTFVGSDAGNSNTTGYENTFVGQEAGCRNETGYWNTFVGETAGHYNTTGYQNTFIGRKAGHSNLTGIYNTFSGAFAGYSNTTANYNTFSGSYSGYKNTTGSYNTFSGYYAGYSNTTANYNTFSGYQAGYKNTTGSWNTFSGASAGYSNTTGNSNTFSGRYAGYSNTIGNYNTFSGHQAGFSNATGYSNTFSGRYAGYSNITGHNNTIVGCFAGFKTTSSWNTFLGQQTGYNNTTGEENVFIGNEAGLNNTTGQDNTFLGTEAGYSNTTGYENTFLGYHAGYTNTTGIRNVFIGHRTGYNETGSNKLYIANSDTTVPLIYGDFTTGRVGLGTNSPTENLDVGGTARLRGIAAGSGTTVVADGNGKLWKSSSSQKYKTNIEPLDADTDAVLNLRPVKFQWKTTGQEDIGLIAEEVEQQLNDLVIYDNEGRPDAVKYDKVALHLLGVVKAQQEKIAQLEKRLENLENTTQQIKTAKEAQQ